MDACTWQASYNEDDSKRSLSLPMPIVIRASGRLSSKIKPNFIERGW